MWDPGLRQWGIASLRLTHDIRIVPFVLCIDYKGMFGCTISINATYGCFKTRSKILRTVACARSKPLDMHYGLGLLQAFSSNGRTDI
jgi:hypothetical protein